MLTHPTSQAAFATPEQGINTGPVHGGERELRSTYLPPFKRAILDSGATSIMSSYNSYDGVPTVSDEHLLTEILRDEWGYEYYVISDAGGTARLDNAFGVCGERDHECIIREVRCLRFNHRRVLCVLVLLDAGALW